MAQLVERQAVNLQVAGSSPAGGDKFSFFFSLNTTEQLKMDSFKDKIH